MDYGLSSIDIRRIVNVFAANPKVFEVILFGSRAMGNYKAGSDIDLAVVSGTGKLDLNEILDLNTALDELGFLYQFDLQNYREIKDPDVIEHIQRVGKILYKKNAEKANIQE
jgi:predicted nucleotidyltransferase